MLCVQNPQKNRRPNAKPECHLHKQALIGLLHMIPLARRPLKRQTNGRDDQSPSETLVHCYHGQKSQMEPCILSLAIVPSRRVWKGSIPHRRSAPQRRDLVPVLTHDSLPFNSGFALWERTTRHSRYCDESMRSSKPVHLPSFFGERIRGELVRDHADIRQQGRLSTNERVATWAGRRRNINPDAS